MSITPIRALIISMLAFITGIFMSGSMMSLGLKPDAQMSLFEQWLKVLANTPLGAVIAVGIFYMGFLVSAAGVLGTISSLFMMLIRAAMDARNAREQSR